MAAHLVALHLIAFHLITLHFFLTTVAGSISQPRDRRAVSIAVGNERVSIDVDNLPAAAVVLVVIKLEAVEVDGRRGVDAGRVVADAIAQKRCWRAVAVAVFKVVQPAAAILKEKERKGDDDDDDDHDDDSGKRLVQRAARVDGGMGWIVVK